MSPPLGWLAQTQSGRSSDPGKRWPKAKADTELSLPAPPLAWASGKLTASKLLGAEMAAGGRGLIRALHSSPCPAWKRAQSGANGRLKPEYDAVVIGAGKSKEGRARAQGRKAAFCPPALEGPPRSLAAASPMGTTWPGVPVSRTWDGSPPWPGNQDPWVLIPPWCAVWTRTALAFWV